MGSIDLTVADVKLSVAGVRRPMGSWDVERRDPAARGEKPRGLAQRFGAAQNWADWLPLDASRTRWRASCERRLGPRRARRALALQQRAPSMTWERFAAMPLAVEGAHHNIAQPRRQLRGGGGIWDPPAIIAGGFGRFRDPTPTTPGR